MTAPITSSSHAMPHVLPVKAYAAVFGALLALTAITVAVSYVNFGVMNLVVALGVATIKASLVALIFMHLWFDKKFNAIVFVSSLIFLGVFIGLTMADTEVRGVAEPMEAQQPADMVQPFAGTRAEKEARQAAKAKGLLPSDPAGESSTKPKGPVTE